jgi:hypothetical protein
MALMMLGTGESSEAPRREPPVAVREDPDRGYPHFVRPDPRLVVDVHRTCQGRS